MATHGNACAPAESSRAESSRVESCRVKTLDAACFIFVSRVPVTGRDGCDFTLGIEIRKANIFKDHQAMYDTSPLWPSKEGLQSFHAYWVHPNLSPPPTQLPSPHVKNKQVKNFHHCRVTYLCFVQRELRSYWVCADLIGLDCRFWFDSTWLFYWVHTLRCWRLIKIQGIHKRMVRFQKLTRSLFLTLHGHNVHRQQRQLSKFLMR
jgi:hypothetical protein